MDRLAEIAANLEAVRERIAYAAGESGRAPDEITLIAITKTFPVDDVRLLVELGVADVGENRDQEAAPKAAAVPAARWHFVGALQRNKARSVTSYADVIHSVDRVRLAHALDHAAPKPIDVFVQLSLDGDPDRGGATRADLPAVADAVEESTNLRLVGLMCVPPLGAEPAAAYADVATIATELQRNHPSATLLSAGMSGDMEAAIRHGATHVRVGTALLGNRPRHVG